MVTQEHNLEDVLTRFKEDNSELQENECYQLLSGIFSNSKDPLRILGNILSVDTELSRFLKENYLCNK